MNVHSITGKYAEYRTARQWAMIGFLPSTGAKGVKLWSNRYCQHMYVYYGPKEVCPATKEDIQLFFADEKSRKREYDHQRYIRYKRQKKLEKINPKIIGINDIDKLDNMIILDTETTGLDPLNDEILQLSIIDIDGDVLFDSYFKPDFHNAWDQAQRINGISPDTVKNAPGFLDKITEINAIIQAAKTIIVYNAGFDLLFLSANGIDFNSDTAVIDVMIDFAAIYGEWDNYHGNYRWQKLTKAAAYYHYDWSKGGAHDALADCYATLYVLKKLVQ